MSEEGRKLHLGCGRRPLDGWINLDSTGGPGVDIVFDLESCAEQKLPIEDDSIGEMYASHLIEHIDRVLPFMEELWRVARDGCRFRLEMPYGSSDLAWVDPTHKRAMFVQSFNYFQQPFYNFADYGYRGDWIMERAILRIPRSLAGNSDTDELVGRIDRERNLVREFVAELRAIKPPRPNDVSLLTKPALTLDLE